MIRGTNLARLSARNAAASACVLVTAVLLAARPSQAQIPIAQYDGWRVTSDGRVNTFASIATGKGIPEGQPDYIGAGTNDNKDTSEGLHSTRIRSGFIMNVFGFSAQKEVSPNFKVTARVGLWMNIASSRTKNSPAPVDPREVYGKIEGGWGSLLAGSDLSLFGRGGILVDARIAHDYGLGYPCSIIDASGGACGMTAFGAPFPGFDPGIVYATPNLAGLQLSLGIYDPATIANAQLDRAPLPRVEGEAKYEYREKVRLFVSGFWQVLEGTPPGAVPRKNLHTEAWGGQVGGMLALGPIMLGGAAYQGTGFNPITHVAESQLSADSAGVLRKSKGAFGMGAVLISSLGLKVAAGAGFFQLDRNPNDAKSMGPTGSPTNPQLIRQNLGMTVGLYQATGPVRFALEYFRAQHTWYDRDVPSMTDPTMTVGVTTPQQVVNFVNAGMTVVW